MELTFTKMWMTETVLWGRSETQSWISQFDKPIIHPRRDVKQMAGYVKSEFISGLKIETSYQSKVFMDVSLDEISQGVSVKKNKEVQWLGPEEI